MGEFKNDDRKKARNNIVKNFYSHIVCEHGKKLYLDGCETCREKSKPKCKGCEEKTAEVERLKAEREAGKTRLREEIKNTPGLEGFHGITTSLRQGFLLAFGHAWDDDRQTRGEDESNQS